MSTTMKTTARILPAIAYSLLGAFLGAVAAVFTHKYASLTVDVFLLFGGVGAALLAVYGFLRGPSGDGYVSRGASDVKLFGRDVTDPVDPVDQPFSVDNDWTSRRED